MLVDWLGMEEGAQQVCVCPVLFYIVYPTSEYKTKTALLGPQPYDQTNGTKSPYPHSSAPSSS